MKNAYFQIRDAKAVGEKLVLDGNYILPSTLEVKASGDKPGSGQPPPSLNDIRVPGPFKVKWILPPMDSAWHDGIKSAAEGAGYETVELNDFSYPPPR